MDKLPNLLHKGRSYYFSKTVGGVREYHWLGSSKSSEVVLMLKYRMWEEHYKTRQDDFQYLANAWLEHKQKEIADKILKQSTFSEYTKHLRPGARLDREFGSRPLNNLTSVQVQRFVDTGARYQSNRELATLIQMLEFGVNRGMVQKNVAAGTKRNKEQPRSRYVTNEEFALAYRVMPQTIQNLMMISYLTGLRVGDVLDLRLKDAQEDYLHAAEGKTRKRVRFVWTDSLRSIIESSRKENEEFIIEISGRRVSPGYAAKIFRANFPQGEDWKLKDLRAKSATDREDPEMASYALGHGSQSLTDRHYLRNQKGRITAPVESELASLSL